MKRPAYPKYKPSGADFLGDVPEHWDVKRLKFIVSEPLKYGANEAAELDDPALPRYIRITDVDEAGRLREETFKSIPEDVASPYLLRESDLLLARSGATVGKTFFYQASWGRAAYAGYLIRARLNSRKSHPRFVNYFTNSHHYRQWIDSSLIQATIQNVSAEKYANLFIPVPSLPEQRAIAAFLDRETARIDALIQKKQRQIELLQEKRAALISACVTGKAEVKRIKDKNGHSAFRLQPSSFPMKPSGIEWLGDIPEHWEVAKFKRSAFFQEGPGFRNWQFSDTGIRVICVTNITEHGIDFEGYSKHISEEEYVQSYKRFTVNQGDLLLSSSGNSWGKVAEYVDTEPTILNTSTIRVNQLSIPVLSRSFIKWTLQSRATREQLGLKMTGACQPNFGPSHLGEIFVCIPSIHEQRSIGEYLESWFFNIDKMTCRIEHSINVLREYRGSIISASVTGQIRVNEVSLK